MLRVSALLVKTHLSCSSFGGSVKTQIFLRLLQLFPEKEKKLEQIGWRRNKKARFTESMVSDHRIGPSEDEGESTASGCV